ncbi:adenylate/guanylate cyclase domain-containing protein [Ahrensia sp. R2A130]|uniref:adenylate/guanylate cyclase domain-containing protein n=1 Tax=Ahrensia sp. R2A130 TaxID=744979 RepID=UPI0001E0F890|nr:adenylate/guanylate cyclase domain-containing protein [Ahrensia sp. R2A130]EFL89221.1 adenylate/guanylate cyclase [Ahrensia sp. R2A130]
MNTIENLNTWMMTVGRCSNDPIEIVSHFCTTLVEAGVPLWRVNIGQRFANPLLIAWGVIWTPDSTESYDVTHARMLTDGYIGSSFEYVFENQRPLHKSLRGLDPEKDHSSYLEFAEKGGTDFYATFLTYGDGSQHGCTFTTRSENDFAPEHLAMIEEAKSGLSSAMEPITMRKSTRSLLRTYLGSGPSEAVWNGSIQRGERTSLQAVVMFSDLRGFTAFSETQSEQAVFEALDGYFEVVVQAVEKNGGEVLKFMGDGVLSVFPISATDDHAERCRDAANAAQNILVALASLNANRTEADKPELEIGIGINVGEVSYGNIGSQSRLDFTVLGSAVNLASRVESLTKSIGDKVLATASAAKHAPDLFTERGYHEVRGVSSRIQIFGLIRSLY